MHLLKSKVINKNKKPVLKLIIPLKRIEDPSNFLISSINTRLLYEGKTFWDIVNDF